MTKMRSAYSASMPIPLSVHVKRQKRALALGVEARSRGGSSPRNLIALRDQVLEHGGQQRRRRRARRAARRRRPRRRSPRARPRAGPRPAPTSSRGLDALERRRQPADARELEQVVDQLLHPLGAVDGELDVAVGALVELALVAALEHLGEARDLAQRLLQVVRGDVGELLELLRWSAAARAPGASSAASASRSAATSATIRAAHRRRRRRRARPPRAGPTASHLAVEVAARDRAHVARRAARAGGRRRARSDEAGGDQRERGSAAPAPMNMRRARSPRCSSSSSRASAARGLRGRACCRAERGADRVEALLAQPGAAAASPPASTAAIAGSAYSRRQALGRARRSGARSARQPARALVVAPTPVERARARAPRRAAAPVGLEVTCRRRASTKPRTPVSSLSSALREPQRGDVRRGRCRSASSSRRSVRRSSATRPASRPERRDEQQHADDQREPLA